MLVSACQTNKYLTSNCVGWRDMHPKPDTARYIAENDQQFGVEVSANKAYGQKQCGWVKK